MNYSIVDICPITNDFNRFTYLDLGDMPLVNNLLNTKDEAINAISFPLEVQYFTKSKLSCLSKNVDPNLLFSQYSYKSGIVKAYSDHCSEMFEFVDEYLNLQNGDNILDIGGNDGTLLNSFLKLKPNLNVLNVDASVNLTKISEELGVPTYNGFWGIDVCKKLNRKFKLITSTNVFQHTPQIADFVEAIHRSLENNGIWCLEFPYWKTSMETNQFDQVYHEHVYFYLVEPLKLLFDKYELEIIKAVEYPIHGGTLRLLISKKRDYQVCEGVQKIIYEEQLIDEDFYKKWGIKIESHIKKCREYLIDTKQKGKKIVGFGAAAKGCVFLNCAGIDDTILDVVIDDTDLKQDKFIPGVGIQIKSREYLKQNHVDVVIILAHNFKDVIIDSLRDDGYAGQFIVLFPNIEVI